VNPSEPDLQGEQDWCFFYFGQIKSLADEMATAEKPLHNDDIISYVLAGLDEEYDKFVASVNALLKAQKY
jgi:hypothetical protein